MSDQPEMRVEAVVLNDEDRRLFWDLVRDYAKKNKIAPLKLAALCMSTAESIMHDFGATQVSVSDLDPKEWN